MHNRKFDVARLVTCEVVDGNKVFTTHEKPAFEGTKLPEYATNHSAGADFFCAEDVVIPSLWGAVFQVVSEWGSHLIRGIGNAVLGKSFNEDLKGTLDKKFSPTPVHTGIKADMNEDEVLEIYNRSSNPSKLGLILANSVGVIDADYFECEQNDGEIMFAYYNFKPWDVTIKAGDKIGQGVFKKVLRPTEGFTVKNDTRKGGFGSTDETK